ncbi:MAG: hypothetical protein ACK5Y2_05820 [Bdellovibrionales bacterium]
MNNLKKAIFCVALLTLGSANSFAAGKEDDATRQLMLDSLDEEMKNVYARIQKVMDEDKGASLGLTIESVSAKQKKDADNTQKCLAGLLAYSELNKKYALGSEKQLVVLNPDESTKKSTEVIQADGRITTVSANGACESKSANPNMKSIVTDMAAETFSLAKKYQETFTHSTAPTVLAACLSSDLPVIREATRDGMHPYIGGKIPAGKSTKGPTTR